MSTSGETPRKTSGSQYTVVARRYRPQQFTDLVGQDHVTLALKNAIAQNRVGHAYLFTGARGTGKTTSARIFAKCLNCRNSPAPTDRPCSAEDRQQWCDVCQRVSAGEDIDVIEIDGASNRGIDEIRELRNNVNVRPSRARFKIYIIDEVHMLTTQAFNALLKTLEEPPDHVKFFFCTTDPQKIPITVLSRCQRFDFVPVELVEIQQRLAEIAAKEQIAVETEALQLVARRAAGSMRDSQSLFEQLLAGCEKQITAADVYRLLGIADDRRVAEIFAAMLGRKPRETLELIHQSVSAGVDPGQLAQQLVGYARDLMAARLGCDHSVFLQVAADQLTPLLNAAESLTVDQLLMILQILDQTVVKIQHSLHARILLDTAVVRICQLESLRSLSGLLAEVAELAPQTRMVQSTTSETTAAMVPANPAAAPVSADPKKKELDGESPLAPPAGEFPEETIMPAAELPAAELPAAELPVETLWQRVLDQIGDLTRDLAADYRKLVWQGEHNLQVVLNGEYNLQMCSRADRKGKLESILSQLLGRTVRIDFVCQAGGADTTNERKPVISRRQQIRLLEQDPLIKAVIDQFDAEVIDFSLAKVAGPNDRLTIDF